MVISRVLTPEEIGIFSIAFVSTLILQELQNFGVAQYVIQEPRLTREKMRTAIGVTSLVAWSIAVVMFFGASSAASFYGQAGLEQIFPVLAISFVLTPFRVVTSRLLQEASGVWKDSHCNRDRMSLARGGYHRARVDWL